MNHTLYTFYIDSSTLLTPRYNKHIILVGAPISESVVNSIFTLNFREDIKKCSKLFSQEIRDLYLQESKKLITISIGIEIGISDEIIQIIRDTCENAVNCKNIQTNYISSEFLDFFPKYLETLSIIYADVPNNILNILAERYTNLQFVDMQKINIENDVYFNGSLKKLRFYETHNLPSHTELKRLHGVDNVDFEFVHLITPKKISQILLKFIMDPLFLDYTIGIHTDHCDIFSPFPNTTRIQNVLTDVDFLETYDTYKNCTHQELQQFCWLLTNGVDNSNNERVANKFCSYLMYYLMYVQNMKIKVFDNSKEYGRINGLYHSIQMNTNIHPKIKQSMSLILCDAPAPEGVGDDHHHYSYDSDGEY